MWRVMFDYSEIEKKTRPANIKKPLFMWDGSTFFCVTARYKDDNNNLGEEAIDIINNDDDGIWGDWFENNINENSIRD
jgi:hypothetical protein